MRRRGSAKSMIDLMRVLHRSTCSLPFDIEGARTEFAQSVDHTRQLLDVAAGAKLLDGLATTTVEIDDLLIETADRTRLDDNTSYGLVGVSLWGKGAFSREEKLGKNIKAAHLHEIRAGWLIYSRLFARRGAFAIVDQSLDGCFVSNEFRTFEAKPNVPEPGAVKRFIVHAMNSPQYRKSTDAQSTGSTQEAASASTRRTSSRPR